MPAMQIISYAWHVVNTMCWLLGLGYLPLLLFQAVRLWNSLKLPTAMIPLWRQKKAFFHSKYPKLSHKISVPAFGNRHKSFWQSNYS